MKNKTIAVVMGGTSSEREVSLSSGKAILAALKNKGYNAKAIDLEPKNFYEQLKEINADIVFNALHGEYGEDGKIQGFLDMIDMPYTGSDVEACALSMDKVISKKLFAASGIPVSPGISLKKGADLEKQIKQVEEFALPVFIKPSKQGSTIGCGLVTQKEDIEKILKEAFKYDEEVLVERYIKGREFTAAVMLDGSDVKALPVIEIIPHSGSYDYHSKYTPGSTTYVVPAEIDDETSALMQKYAKEIFVLFGLKGVARVDYMADESGIYALEVNTVPGMTSTSLVPKAAQAVGISFEDLCEKILLSSIKE